MSLLLTGIVSEKARFPDKKAILHVPERHYHRKRYQETFFSKVDPPAAKPPPGMSAEPLSTAQPSTENLSMTSNSAACTAVPPRREAGSAENKNLLVTFIQNFSSGSARSLCPSRPLCRLNRLDCLHADRRRRRHRCLPCRRLQRFRWRMHRCRRRQCRLFRRRRSSYRRRLRRRLPHNKHCRRK